MYDIFVNCNQPVWKPVRILNTGGERETHSRKFNVGWPSKTRPKSGVTLQYCRVNKFKSLLWTAASKICSEMATLNRSIEYIFPIMLANASSKGKGPLSHANLQVALVKKGIFDGTCSNWFTFSVLVNALSTIELGNSVKSLQYLSKVRM